jgi:hypothetical protein
MGLTIHYNMQSRARANERVYKLVEQMRQFALDFPFEHVDNQVQHLEPKICQIPLDELRGRPEFDLILDGTTYVDVNKNRSVQVQPLEMFVFNTIPGPGSEWATFGLAKYPKEIKYNDKVIKTNLPGWQWRSFCKTQYASRPQCGGIPNFIRCHLSVIHLLDKIVSLPTIKVEVNDEGEYGRSYYTDDPRAKKPVYTWHDGKYSVKALVEEVGEWNEMIATVFGQLKDVMPVVSPISSYSNFEYLEFKGQQQEHLIPFLQAIKNICTNLPLNG